MGQSFLICISRRYNDRISHDDEEKSKKGKRYREDIIFLRIEFFLPSDQKVIIDSRYLTFGIDIYFHTLDKPTELTNRIKIQRN